jgi:hypothetical protein
MVELVFIVTQSVFHDNKLFHIINKTFPPHSYVIVRRFS